MVPLCIHRDDTWRKSTTDEGSSWRESRRGEEPDRDDQHDRIDRRGDRRDRDRRDDREHRGPPRSHDEGEQIMSRERDHGKIKDVKE